MSVYSDGTDYAKLSAGVTGGPPFQFSGLINLDTVDVTSVVFSLFNDTSGYALNYNSLYISGSNELVVDTRDTGAVSQITSAGTISADTWHHVGGDWASASSRFAYLDGVGTENTTPTTPATPDETNIFASTNNANIPAGNLREVGIFNVTGGLDPLQWKMLSGGVRPIDLPILTTQTGGLVAYQPFISGVNDVPYTGPAFTNFGLVSDGDDPVIATIPDLESPLSRYKCNVLTLFDSETPDSSGNNNNMYFTTGMASIVGGFKGSAIEFDFQFSGGEEEEEEEEEVTTYMNWAAYAGSFSVGMFVKGFEGVADQMVMRSYFAAGGANTFSIRSGTGGTNYELYRAGVSIGTFGSTSDTEFSHLGIVYFDNIQVIVLYYNGYPVEVINADIGDLEKVFIGKIGNTENLILDELQIFDGTLTPSQMERLYYFNDVSMYATASMSSQSGVHIQVNVPLPSIYFANFVSSGGFARIITQGYVSPFLITQGFNSQTVGDPADTLGNVSLRATKFGSSGSTIGWEYVRFRN